MNIFPRSRRLIKIYWVVTKQGLDQLLPMRLRFVVFKIIGRLLRTITVRFNRKCIEVRIRETLEELGPIFVKFGQLLSTRPDIFLEELIAELVKLQDNVPAFPGEEAKAIVEDAYGAPVEEYFNRFDIEPLASASVAQVHRAETKDGKPVVVKILRPKVDQAIKRDLLLLYCLAGVVETLWSEGWRLCPKELVKEFERSLMAELDLVREAANASQLRRNFMHSSLIYVPEVIWPLARKNVLVLEEIVAVPITDLQTLHAKKVNMKRLAERGVEIFFTQVFRDSFFHADMHPGNVFVDITDPENPRYAAVDFGIVGTLDPTDQRYLAENFLAFFERDYQRVATLHVESGWVPPNIRVVEFEAVIRSVCEPVFEKPLKDISCGQVLLKLFQTARQFDMVIQPQLLLLQKTLLAVEGLGRQLYPQLDLWSTAKPFLKRWMRQQVGPRAFVRKFKEQSPLWAERMPEVPDLLYRFLKQQFAAMPGQFERPGRRRERRPWLMAGAAACFAGVSVGIFTIGPALHPSLWAVGGGSLVALLIA